MVDLAAGTEIRNYGLKRTPEIIDVGYQKQDLKIQEEELSRSLQQLVVEEQVLKDPKWLDAVASKSLGMIIVRPDQIIPASIQTWKGDNAKGNLMGNLVQPYGPEKPALLN